MFQDNGAGRSRRGERRMAMLADLRNGPTVTVIIYWAFCLINNHTNECEGQNPPLAALPCWHGACKTPRAGTAESWCGSMWDWRGRSRHSRGTASGESDRTR